MKRAQIVQRESLRLEYKEYIEGFNILMVNGLKIS